jgi:hypothetical protein
MEWHPEHRFQLKDGDANTLLQIGGGDLMWQKERLLAIAIRHLPDHVKYVAWIDCDVLFDNSDWQDEARELLDRNYVIQLFSDVAFPDESESQRLIDSRGLIRDNVNIDQMPRRESFLGLYGELRDDIVSFDLERRFQPDESNSYNIMKRPAYGFAWAAQSSLLRKIGVYDRCIMGGGDLLIPMGYPALMKT